MTTTPTRDQHVVAAENNVKQSARNANMQTASPSVRVTLSPAVTIGSSTSPPSAFPSPMLGAMADLTPLPSPLVAGASPGPWKRLAAESTTSEAAELSKEDERISQAESGVSPSTLLPRRKPYHGLVPGPSEIKQINLSSHQRNRSLSEYVVEAVHLPRPRLSTVSGLESPPNDPARSGPCMKREEYLAERRGLAGNATGLPTPPQSIRGVESGDSDTPLTLPSREVDSESDQTTEYFVADMLKDQTRRKWRAVRKLGQGTFSRVVLAALVGTADGDGTGKDDRKQLVAVKIVEHGPAGGASEERVESSLKRELDIMKAVHHPSLVHLTAFSVEPTRALLVMTYCPGGDLFEVASQKHHLLSAGLIRRIFAELVAATRYLHEHLIVHRDIKLESKRTALVRSSLSDTNFKVDVLLNMPCDQISDTQNWQTFPFAVVTLTDLGLSRRIDPADPLLHTRCGSEDYASPELLMGQAYDGRQTDAWALGVVLYALMEGRLPFDPLPGASEHQKMRSRTVHRIARCDWSWVKFADDQGEPGDFGELESARLIVEGLLKRVSRRLTLEKVAGEAWVRDAIEVEGGIKARDEGVGPEQ